MKLENRILLSIVILILISCAGENEEIMTKNEMERLNIFPNNVGNRWIRERGPVSPFGVRGFLQAIYRNKGTYCKFKVWVIDKGSDKKAEEWLEKLSRGVHTAFSIRPFPPGYAKMKKYFSKFTMVDTTLRNQTVYERVDTTENSLLKFSLYFTEGRFVIGGANIQCEIKNVHAARQLFYPVFEGLNIEK